MRLRASRTHPARGPQAFDAPDEIGRQWSDRGDYVVNAAADRERVGSAEHRELGGRASADPAAGDMTARVLVHRAALGRSPLIVVASLEPLQLPSGLVLRTAAALSACGHAALLVTAHGGGVPPDDDRQEGLADRLLDVTRLPPAVIRASSGLSVLPAGRWTAEADREVQRGGLDRVLRASALHFDAVLIDVGFRRGDELAALSAKCDAALLVVRRNHTPLLRIETAIDRLAGRGVAVLATILS